jgi:hypothetical protein
LGLLVITSRAVRTTRPFVSGTFAFGAFEIRPIRSRPIALELRALLIARQFEARLGIAMLAAGPPLPCAFFASSRSGQFCGADRGLRRFPDLASLEPSQ